MRGRSRLPVLLNILLLPTLPALSRDGLTYVAYGYLGHSHGHNPLLQAAEIARQTTIGPKLAALGWETEAGPSPYGIIWTHLEIFAAMVGRGNPFIALIVLKSIVVAASLGSAYLIWWFLGVG